MKGLKRGETEAAWILAVAIPILYILSPSFFFWMEEHGMIEIGDGLQVFMTPLEKCYDRFEWVEGFYDTYFNLLNVSP